MSLERLAELGKAGVWTGASQYCRIASSSRVTVMEQPAISRDVTKEPVRYRLTRRPCPSSRRRAAWTIRYSSIAGVPPKPLTSSRHCAPGDGARSVKIAAIISAAMSLADASFTRRLPGSPWMPTPISISSSASEKLGLPAAGIVQESSATPIERVCALTALPSSASRSRLMPCSAAAPTIFSTTSVPATPRRPADQMEASTATSSSVITVATLPDASASRSAAIWKFITSPS